MKKILVLLVEITVLISILGCAGGPQTQAPKVNITKTVEKAPYVETRTDIFVEPKLTTDQTGTGMSGDADDPALWVHPEDPARSVIFGVDKALGFYAWDMKGKEILLQDIYGKPGNIDVRYGLKLGDREVDIVAVNIRKARYTRISKVAVYAINPDYTSGDDLLIKLADGESENNIVDAETYGFGLYKSPKDSDIYAFCGPKYGGGLKQYRIEDDGSGQAVKVTEVRALTFESEEAKEGIVCDDENGYVYVGEEAKAIHKYYAEPDADPDPIFSFATEGYSADREGVSLYKFDDGSGYVVVVDQGGILAEAASILRIYDLEEPHELLRTVAHLNKKGKSIWDDDGVEVSSKPLPGFPHGVVIAHDGKYSDYPIYDWADIAGDQLRIAHPEAEE